MHWRIALWVILSLITLTLLILKPTIWRQGTLLAQDLMMQHLAQDTPVSSVILIDIDEASLDLIGPWPWSRALIAELIQKLNQTYQANSIGLDIIFPESRSIQEDQRLVQSVKKNNVSLAVVWDYQGQTPTLAVGETGQGIAALGNFSNAKGYLGNFSSLAATNNIGHISPIPDVNGKIRYIPPIVTWNTQHYPMLALSMLAQIKKQTLHPIMRDQCLYPFTGQALSLCDDDVGLWTIPYRHHLSSFTVIPAWQVITEQVPLEQLKHQNMIVGSSALGLADRVVTPLANITPGMMVHAQILDYLLNAKETTRHAGLHLILFIVISLSSLSFILMRFGIRHGILFVVTSSTLWIVWVGMDYQQGHPLPDIALPIFLLWLWLASQSALEWSLVKQQSQRIYRLFEDYLPPHLLKQALATPNEQLLQPQQRRVSVLFADIAGFTTMTEQMPAQEAVALTRHILSVLTRAVYTYDGTLDKYMGDALMAFWNAPLDQPKHAYYATQAALMMREELQRLNETRSALGLPPIHVRIGINTGDVLVGDLGTAWRHAYTVLGDAVNVAQRLMIAARQLGVDIALGEQTAEHIEQAELVGDMHLPGREQLERVFVLPITINPYSEKINRL